MNILSPSVLRSLLFVPASRPELIAKAQSGHADAVIFDLEDAVAERSKTAARRNVSNAMREGLRKPAFLRVSHPATPAFRDDMELVADVPSFDNFLGILVPKVKSPVEIGDICRTLTKIEIGRACGSEPLAIIPLIECCVGLRNAFEICRATTRVAGICIASAEEGDFMVDLGGRWTEKSNALLYPRSKLVVDARAAGIGWIIDGVFMNLESADALRKESELARELGYNSKMAIHPDQVKAINEVFSPSDAEMAQAQRLVEAFRQAQESGVGALNFEGRMVDLANFKLAERTLSLRRTN